MNCSRCKKDLDNIEFVSPCVLDPRTNEAIKLCLDCFNQGLDNFRKQLIIEEEEIKKRQLLVDIIN